MNPFHPKYQSCSFQDFRIEEVLSRSTNGSVFLGKHQLFNQKFILKEKVVSELGRKKSVLHEVRILRDLKHPNLITCYGYFWKSSRVTRRNLVMILRYYEKGDLSMMIERRSNQGRFFSEYEILLTLYQICQGLKYLHEKGVIHRDIKSSNVFISKKNEVVIGDLGISRKLNLENREELVRTFSAGTPIYMSPEVIRNRPYDGRTDIWSLGIMVWEMMTTKFPFESMQIQELLGKICHSKPGGDQHGMIIEELKSRYSDELVNLCLSMLKKDNFHRPTSTQVLEDVISQLSKYQQNENSPEGKNNRPPRLMKIKSGEPYLTTSNIRKRRSPHQVKRKKNVDHVHQFQRGNYHDFHENRKILLQDFELSTPMKRLHVKKKKKKSRRSSRVKGTKSKRRRKSSSEDDDDEDDGSSRRSTNSNGSGIWVPVKRTMNRVKEKKMLNLQKEHQRYNGYHSKKPGKKQFLERKFMGEMSERERRYMERKEKFMESQGSASSSSSSFSLVNEYYDDGEAAAGGGRRKDRVRKKRDPRRRRRRRGEEDDSDIDDDIEDISDILYNKVSKEGPENDETGDHSIKKKRKKKRRRRRRKGKRRGGGGGGKKRFVENFHRDPINFSLKTFMSGEEEEEENDNNNNNNNMYLEDPRAYQRAHIQPISRQGWTGNLGKEEKKGILERRKRWEEIKNRRSKEKREREKLSKSLDLEKNRRGGRYTRKKERNRNVLARSANLTVESSRLFGDDEIVPNEKFWNHEEDQQEQLKTKKKRRKDGEVQKNNYFESSEGESEPQLQQRRRRTRNFEKRRRKRRRRIKKGGRREKRVFSSEEEEEEESDEEEEHPILSSKEEDDDEVTRRRTSEETESESGSTSSSEVESGEGEKDEVEDVEEVEDGQEIRDLGEKKSYKRYNPIFGTWETIYV